MLMKKSTRASNGGFPYKDEFGFSNFTWKCIFHLKVHKNNYIQLICSMKNVFICWKQKKTRRVKLGGQLAYRRDGSSATSSSKVWGVIFYNIQEQSFQVMRPCYWNQNSLILRIQKNANAYLLTEEFLSSSMKLKITESGVKSQALPTPKWLGFSPSSLELLEEAELEHLYS